jgi:hypothetical protein
MFVTLFNVTSSPPDVIPLMAHTRSKTDVIIGKLLEHIFNILWEPTQTNWFENIKIFLDTLKLKILLYTRARGTSSGVVPLCLHVSPKKLLKGFRLNVVNLETGTSRMVP